MCFVFTYLQSNYNRNKYLFEADVLLPMALALKIKNINIYNSFITGNGDVVEPEDGVMAIGSGGAYAKSAALALVKHTQLEPFDIVKQALEIAADICVYTNNNFTIEKL